MRTVRLLSPVSVVLFFAVFASTASASTQIGQLAPVYAAASCGGRATLQSSVEAGTNPYTVPAGGGVITAWKTQTGGNAGTVKLKVYRPTGVAGEYVGVGEEGPHSILANTAPSFTSGVRIPVQAGDVIGMVGLAVNCESEYKSTRPNDRISAFPMGVDPTPGQAATLEVNNVGYTVEIEATVEPDSDHDGYGDETQDACLHNPLGHEAPCPTLPPPPDTTPPTLELKVKPVQTSRRAVAVVAKTDEGATLKATGSLAIVGGSSFSLPPTTISTGAGEATSVALTIPKSVRGKIAKALAKGRRVRASVHVVATDAAGNSSNASQSFRVASAAKKKSH